MTSATTDRGPSNNPRAPRGGAGLPVRDATRLPMASHHDSNPHGSVALPESRLISHDPDVVGAVALACHPAGMLMSMSFDAFDRSEFQRFAHSGARILPFPLATVAWSYLSAASPSARLESLFNFTEVAARLVGIINLSALRADRELYLVARPSLQGVGASPSTRMRRATLGVWVNLDLSLARSLRRLSDEQQRQLYRVDRLARVAPLISRDLG